MVRPAVGDRMSKEYQGNAEMDDRGPGGSGPGTPTRWDPYMIPRNTRLIFRIYLNIWHLLAVFGVRRIRCGSFGEKCRFLNIE